MGVRLVLLLLAAAFLFSPGDLNSCGPFIPSAVFSLQLQPDDPGGGFARGNLGVLQPGFRRKYLIVAYRYLNGLDVIAADAKAVLADPDDSAPPKEAPMDAYRAMQVWTDTRAKITGQAQPGSFFAFKSYGSDYQSFLNCPAGAFLTAAHTLEDRAQKFGAHSPQLAAWLGAQDQVFSNCNGKEASIPAPLAGSADRAYQIAAANFYAENFDIARAQFLEIANDTASPWSAFAPYLAARCLIRKASLEKTDGTPWTQAEGELRALLKDPKEAAYGSSIEGLLRYIDVRRHPEESLMKLGRELAQDRNPAGFSQDVADYLYLWNISGPKVTALVRDDLSLWLECFGDRNCHAKNDSTLPWLIASLAQGEESALPAAANVPATSPGYASVSYYSIRILLRQKKAEEARERLDRLIAANTFSRSTHNLFLAQRMSIARTADEFLRDAQRIPAGTDDGAGDFSAAKPGESSPAFDWDAAAILNGETPLWLLKRLAASKLLTPALRRNMTQAAWVRAVLLDNDAIAAALAPKLTGLPLANFASAKTLEERRFAAVFAMLHAPESRPYVEQGLGRLPKPGHLDIYRDNWWSRPENTPPPEAPWLTPAQRAEGIKEAKTIAQLPAAPDYLAAAVVAWAKTHPADPRLPEALALAVRVTRYGIGDAATGKYSKAAFDLLHGRYPASAWAKRTPYWFRYPY